MFALGVSTTTSLFGLLVGFTSYTEYVRHMVGPTCCIGDELFNFGIGLPALLSVAVGSLIVAKRMALRTLRDWA
jgi:hypothetical protein